MHETPANSTPFLLLCALVQRAGGRLVIHSETFVNLPPGQLKISSELDGAVVLEYGEKGEYHGGQA